MLRAPISKIRSLVNSYRHRPALDLSVKTTDPEHALTRYLLYYLMPIWAAAGLLDWYWHKRTDIEHTAGVYESLIHSLMFAEVGAPILMGLFLEIDAGVLASMAAALLVHEATAFWDVSYASGHRDVRPSEQHTHSFLEVLPFMALSMTSALHWDQIQAICGIGPNKPDWGLRMKKQRLPGAYLAGIAGLLLLGIVIPYGNELLRCARATKEQRYHGNCEVPLQSKNGMDRVA